MQHVAQHATLKPYLLKVVNNILLQSTQKFDFKSLPLLK